ncbi:MAG: helix-turn-helix transcriptional regulator [Salinivenus sp.]
MIDLSGEKYTRAQRVLLSPLQYGDPQAWLRAAAGAVQRVLRGDHAFALQLGPRTNTITVHEVDPAFKTKAEAYGAEVLSPSGPEASLPLPVRMHLQRVENGSGAYHERDLAPRDEIKQSPFYREVAAPFGVKYATGLTVVEGASETSLCVAFERGDAPGFSREASARLGLLTPAFEAGLRHLERFRALGAHLRRVLDDLADALFVFSVDGREMHRNRALVDLLRSVRDPDPLCRAAADVALSVAERRPTGSPFRGRRELRAQTERYVLYGTYAGPLLDVRSRILVSVVRDSPYPPPLLLRTRYGLTPREAEVALLVARGPTDAQIAERLGVSVHTVRRHVSAVRAKMEVDTRTGIAYRLAQGKARPSSDRGEEARDE